jgi:tetratricopeptide (TPR) repeat protein
MRILTNAKRLRLLRLLLLAFMAAPAPAAGQSPRLPDAAFDGYFIGVNQRRDLAMKPYPPGTSPGQVVPLTSRNLNFTSAKPIWFVNGILNHLDSADPKESTFFKTLQAIADRTGQPVIGLYNATNGFVLDVRQASFDIRGSLDNPATRSLANALYDQLAGGNEVHLMGHSQGTAIINQALKDVKRRFESQGLDHCQVLDKLSKVTAEIYGSPVYSFVNGPSYYHRCNYEDPVCNFGDWRRHKDMAISMQDIFDESVIKTEVYGGRAVVENFNERVLLPKPFADHEFLPIYLPRREAKFPIPPGCDSAYLYLIDTSGSMGEFNKYENALSAALESLKRQEERSKASTRFSATAAYSFAGACSEGSTQQLSPFTTDIKSVSELLPGVLPRPGGETPLPQASAVSIRTLREYMRVRPYIQNGYVVLLSDGMSTCDPVRPMGTFGTGARRGSSGGLSQVLRGLPSNISFLTIGFDIAAGSPAERDLQYLSFATGGKYYNAPDKRRLVRAFQKLTQSYFPKESALDAELRQRFDAGLRKGANALYSGQYTAALASFRQLEAELTKGGVIDPSVYYNIAQASEAIDHYRVAAEYYRNYLAAAPEAKDKARVQQKIVQMKQDYVDQVDYYLKILRSDHAYLKNYYQSLFNRKNDELAAEFAGFVLEKSEFYVALADVFEVKSTWLENGSRDLADLLHTLADRVHLTTFDRDAVSLLPLTISQLGELTDLLESKRDQIVAIP